MDKNSVIKFSMDTDWLIHEPIDFEHKKYILLAYFKKLDKLLDQNKIYPTFIELSLHLASIQTLIKENIILYTDKVFKSFDDEVLLKELKAKELPPISPEERIEIDKILKYSSSKFFDYFNIVKSYWSLVYDSISVSIKRNKKNLKIGSGYMTFSHKKTNLIYVWEYEIKQYTPDLNEYFTDIKLIYEGDKKRLTLNEVIDNFSTFSNELIKTAPVFSMKTSEEYPLNETLLPLFKRKLMSYILQTVRLDTIKNILE